MRRPWRAIALATCALLAACSGGARDARPVVRFWAMGYEGEVVAQMLPEFQRLHPGIRVGLQQQPWTAAHEKLLTAFAGDSLPDVCALGNTWVAEFAALGALQSAASEPLSQGRNSTPLAPAWVASSSVSSALNASSTEWSPSSSLAYTTFCRTCSSTLPPSPFSAHTT